MVMCVGVGFEWFADDSSFAYSFSVLFFKFVGKKREKSKIIQYKNNDLLNFTSEKSTNKMLYETISR
jgi:hypothetical protein